jgi:hypothetical protein
MPATSEAARIAIFDALMVSGAPVNARLVMKIDIVEPMPPSRPAPRTWRHARSSGRRHRPSVTAAHVNRKIPTGLPTTRPSMMPMLLAPRSSVAQPVPITMPVLASANSGRIRKVTGLCRMCSSWCEGECASSSLGENGIAKASSTPAMVACTPDLSIRNHISAPPAR